MVRLAAMMERLARLEATGKLLVKLEEACLTLDIEIAVAREI